jgi:heat shock protein 5
MVEIKGIMDGEDRFETLTRAKIEEFFDDLFRGTLKPVQKVVCEADLKKSHCQESTPSKA